MRMLIVVMGLVTLSNTATNLSPTRVVCRAQNSLLFIVVMTRFVWPVARVHELLENYAQYCPSTQHTNSCAPYQSRRRSQSTAHRFAWLAQARSPQGLVQPNATALNCTRWWHTSPMPGSASTSATNTRPNIRTNSWLPVDSKPNARTPGARTPGTFNAGN